MAATVSIPALGLQGFSEAGQRAIPIRDLGLKIAGTALEPILASFEKELEAAGIRRVRPRFYLSTEWGVPYETVAIAIPFYLARPDLTELHAEQGCHVEGSGSRDILRYLRHETGHVINYAYRLHDQKEWTDRFGSMSKPYLEEYRPHPFSREFVHHLPGWYGQKHPDEDWAETFAVWMTPGLDWRTQYAKWPGALRKLDFCARVMASVVERDPIVTATELDGDVGTLTVSLDQFYRDSRGLVGERPQGLDQMLTTLFADTEQGGERHAASNLVRRVERDLPFSVYEWTGYMPERTRWLLDFMAERTDALQLTFRAENEPALTIALASFVTAHALSSLQTPKLV